MTKYILIEEDGFRWACLVSAIAENRAKYYAGRGEDYQAAFDFIMDESDGEEAMEWLSNNMNWDDINPRPRLIYRPETPDEPEDMPNSDMEFKDIDGVFAPID